MREGRWRKKILLGLLLMTVWSFPVWANDADSLPDKPPFTGSIEPISEALAQRMTYSYREDCPVPLSELRYLRLRAVNERGESYVGELVVHRLVAEEVVQIFRDLYEAGFPVASMRLVSDFLGDDDTSMKANNTSGFNCRPKAGRKLAFSSHAYGIAVDINPLWNPYISTKGVVKPPEAAAFTDRTRSQAGMIHRDDACRMAFRKRGWQWGGLWRRNKDYQHFERIGLSLEQGKNESSGK